MIPADFALLDDPGAALKARCQLIRAARHRILAQYYSWEEDGSGKLLLAERSGLPGAGCGSGCSSTISMVVTTASSRGGGGRAGIEVRLFNPSG